MQTAVTLENNSGALRTPSLDTDTFLLQNEILTKPIQTESWATHNHEYMLFYMFLYIPFFLYFCNKPVPLYLYPVRKDDSQS